ncbi:MAG: hypothetical protein NZO16_07190 [Deltaproteobacteria bacterium]|nr:hypothetical protein [Deltaproteobacteria bacterium]
MSWFEINDNGILSASERKLLLAVLQKAVSDYLVGEGEIRENARDWLFDDEFDASLKFRFVCDCLGLDPSAFRAHLRRMEASSSSDLEDVLV